MSTTTTSIQALDEALNQQILAGDILGAFEKYYAEDVEMQENSSPSTKGKAANFAREKAFVESVEQFHGARVLSSAVNGNRTFSEWELDATYKGAGRFVLRQVAVREWKDGEIVREQFYYNKG